MLPSLALMGIVYYSLRGMIGGLGGMGGKGGKGGAGGLFKFGSRYTHLPILYATYYLYVYISTA